ncbi:hypothetical protein [uncultured Serinicoccus sp.]|uniref:trypsin-like serine peptidase n=1 Tax=uncultured Serinicoccus sp. TaxID=735514 RepID=UPI0026129399|nr:hypothetical protein [uncultured Serinicoccus sp.]
MRPAGKRTLALIGTGAVALSMVGATGAGAAPGNGEGDGQDKAVARHAAAATTTAQAEVRAYWTPERMKNAIPREMAKPDGKGKPGRSESSAQAVQAPVQAELGKVFFTLGGANYVCSGTATDSANGDVVTTAGHCLNEGPGSYATNFAFVPAYDNGARPYGTWVAESLVAPSAWVNSGDFNHDVGFAVMAEQGARASPTSPATTRSPSTRATASPLTPSATRPPAPTTGRSCGAAPGSPGRTPGAPRTTGCPAP